MKSVWFADDKPIITSTEIGLQKIIDPVDRAAKILGMKIH